MIFLKKTFPLSLLGILLLILFNLSACRASSPVTETPTLAVIPGVGQLRFTDPETGKRFNDLNASIQALIDQNWKTNPYHLSGNFYEAAWCRGSGTRPDCQGSSANKDIRDQHILALNTLFYPQDFPKVFGLGFQAVYVPPTQGWGAVFNFSEGGGSVMGEGWSVIFSEYKADSGEPDALISLGSGAYQYRVLETTIGLDTGLPMRADLALHLESPQAMRERGQAQIQALAGKVRSQISAHQVPACDWQESTGNGIPPTCKPRAMTAVEEAEELARAEAFFKDEEKLLGDHYQEMYAAWMNAFPFDKAWH